MYVGNRRRVLLKSLSPEWRLSKLLIGPISQPNLDHLLRNQPNCAWRGIIGERGVEGGGNWVGGGGNAGRKNSELFGVWGCSIKRLSSKEQGGAGLLPPLALPLSWFFADSSLSLSLSLLWAHTLSHANTHTLSLILWFLWGCWMKEKKSVCLWDFVCKEKAKGPS